MLKKPGTIKRGDVITADHLNGLRDYGIKGLRAGPGVRLHVNAAGLATISMINAVHPRMAAAGMVLMVIISHENDYLGCRNIDAQSEGDPVYYVAKPYKLRHVAGNYPNVTALTSQDSSEVDVTVSGNDETWVLPSELDYDIGATIYAMRVPATDVLRNNEELTWIDCNVDGRAWIIDQ